MSDNPKFEFTYEGERLFPYVTHYVENKNVCLKILDEYMRPFLTASVNIDPQPLHRFYCKDYAENTGIGQALQDAGIAKPTGEAVKMPHVTIELYEFTPEFCRNFHLPHPSFGSASDSEDSPDEDAGLVPEATMSRTEREIAEAAKHDAEAIARGKAAGFVNAHAEGSSEERKEEQPELWPDDAS